jgi:hypothetical protein
MQVYRALVTATTLAAVLAACGGLVAGTGPDSGTELDGAPDDGVPPIRQVDASTDAGAKPSDAASRDSGQEADVHDASDSMPDAPEDTTDDPVNDAPATAPDSNIDIDAACSGASGNIFVIAGDDWVYKGPPLTVTDGSWGVTIFGTDKATGMPNTLYFSILDSTEGTWEAEFSTNQLGLPIQIGNYPDAERAAFAEQGHPGLDVDGQGRGCDGITGRFVVLDVEATPGDSEAGTMPVVQSFTATFQQSCEFGTPMDVGCIHFSQ